MNALEPLMMKSSPSRTALVARDDASLPALGSVRQYDENFCAYHGTQSTTARNVVLSTELNGAQHITQCKRAAHLHRNKVREPLLALLLVAERVHHPAAHVVDGQVGGGACAPRRQRLKHNASVDTRQVGTTDVLFDKHA